MTLAKKKPLMFKTFCQQIKIESHHILQENGTVVLWLGLPGCVYLSVSKGIQALNLHRGSHRHVVCFAAPSAHTLGTNTPSVLFVCVGSAAKGYPFNSARLVV